MRKTYKFKAIVSETTAKNAENWLWACQQLYNTCLEQRILIYKQHKAGISKYDQMSQLPELKAAFPEFKAVGSQVLQEVVDRLDKAYQAFFSRIKRVETPGFPRFRSASRYDSFTLKQAGWKLEGRYLKITNVGIFKLRLSREILGRIKTVTVRRDNRGGWWVCFSCDQVPAREWDYPSHESVGIDVGLKHFCVDSDPSSEPIENPRYYRKAQAKLRRQQRKVSRRKKGSNRRRKVVKSLTKTHQQIANMRSDFLHKTANHYIERYHEIYVEDLKVSNMVKNRHLSKSISDAGWSTFFELLTWKAEEAARKVIRVNPRGTSQKCSGCGEVVPKSLAVRIHHCKHCGLILDRDRNAALNIKAG